jgi:hypothetical protein
LWSERGVGKYGAGKKLATKETLAEAYQELITDYPTAEFTGLKINDVSETSATVKLRWGFPFHGRIYYDSCTIYFVKENNQWMMIGNDY